MAWQRLAGTCRLWVTHSCTVVGVMLNAAASLLMPPAAETARLMGDVDCMPALLGNTYSIDKALPKINLESLISAMNSGGHIGQKLQRQAERLGLKPSQVAELFGVKSPSVYDWYAHGRIHKKHYPVLVAKFGQPLEWWLDFAPTEQAQPPTPELAGLSHAALELARLFDLIPTKDRIKRAQAQVSCGQIIIDLLQETRAVPTDTDPDLRTHKT
jgi:hypothetical protein